MSKNRNCYLCEYYKDEYCENLELKPCYPQEGCEDFSKRIRMTDGDLISRQAVLDGITDYISEVGSLDGNNDEQAIINIIKNSPSITTTDPLNRLILSDRWEEFNRWLKEKESEEE